MTENQRTIIHALSDEIYSQSFQCASEQHAPGADPDRSDDYIKERQENVAQLRRIREQLEDMFTGRLL